ncbi:MAG: GHKL domain-containing protein [Verrucomicrobia bacterium]|nr:GHKL domain-containing protein [Verrucomicrobiota bacterium]
MDSTTYGQGLPFVPVAHVDRISEPISAPLPRSGWAIEPIGASGQLVHAARLAALGEIAAGVAHEMNQPLAAIRMLVTSMLADIDGNRLDTERAHQWLDTINEQIGRISWIIGHVRSFSRDEPPDKQAATDVGETVHNTLALLSAQFYSRGINVEAEVAPPLPGVQVDNRYLEQVLINLLSNARDALDTMPDGTPKQVWVRAFASPDGGSVVLEVIDNGPGMPPEVRERVFEAFFTTKQASQGTGIGLSIVRTILAKCGAQIAVETQPGEGTTFRVVLPAAPSSTDTIQERTP